MYKKLFFVSVGVWALTLGAFLFLFVRGNTSTSTDNRQAIHLVPSEKDEVLKEMRQVLKALNGTMKSLGQNDFKEASLAAQGAGGKIAVDINPVIMTKLPLEFKKLGMSMHDDFDKLSGDLKKNIPQQEALVRLGEITNKCIACHATYRLP